MASDHDAAEFIDGDFQPPRSPYSVSSSLGSTLRAPSREEVDTRVAEAQQKLTELKRAQEELERQRSALEETRRRQAEFQTGRQEMLQHLTRGLGLLEGAEFNARRDAEQMAKALQGLREAQSKIEAIHEETWTQDSFTTELTRALTTLENARMEWNAARLKFPLLADGARQETENNHPVPPTAVNLPPPFGAHSFGELCRLGFALTWPLATVLLVGMGLLLAVLLRR